MELDRTFGGLSFEVGGDASKTKGHCVRMSDRRGDVIEDEIFGQSEALYALSVRMSIACFDSNLTC